MLDTRRPFHYSKKYEVTSGRPPTLKEYGISGEFGWEVYSHSQLESGRICSKQQCSSNRRQALPRGQPARSNDDVLVTESFQPPSSIPVVIGCETAGHSTLSRPFLAYLPLEPPPRPPARPPPPPLNWPPLPAPAERRLPTLWAALDSTALCRLAKPRSLSRRTSRPFPMPWKASACLGRSVLCRSRAPISWRP